MIEEGEGNISHASKGGWGAALTWISLFVQALKLAERSGNSLRLAPKPQQTPSSGKLVCCVLFYFNYMEPSYFNSSVFLIFICMLTLGYRHLWQGLQLYMGMLMPKYISFLLHLSLCHQRISYPAQEDISLKVLKI